MPEVHYYNCNGTNSSGHGIAFCATNFRKISDDLYEVYPHYKIQINDERTRHYVLDREEKVAPFYEYYLSLSEDARAARQEDILADFFVQCANPNPAPLASAPIDPENRDLTHYLEINGIPTAITCMDLAGPTPLRTQLRIEYKIQVYPRRLWQDQDLGAQS